jgi:acetyl esterase
MVAVSTPSEPSSPGRRPTAKATQPAPGRAKAATKKAATKKAATTDPSSGSDAGAAGSGGPLGGRRGGPGRGIYDRRRQRAAERWPVPARFNAWLFRHPETVLTLLGRRAPVEIEGRVLNRSTQAMLELGNRVQMLGLSSGPTFDQEVVRRQLLRMAVIAMPVRTDVYVTGRKIPSAESPEGSGGIPVQVYRRFGSGVGAGAGLGVRPPGIVYYHGGGWISGDLRTHDASCRLLAAVSGCVVVSVDYRLAPEYPFPAAVDDAVAAYAWVHRHADELGIAEGRVGVMGDSAGGNLAAVVSLRTREGEPTAVPGLPGPVAQGLIYPSVNLQVNPESTALGDGFFLTLESMEQMRAAYVPDEADWKDPGVSPLLTEDLSGAAPALVVTAGFDPLHYDGDAYADKLGKAGVDVEHRHYEDQVHGFFGMGILADSLALSTEVCDAMGRLMYRHHPAAPSTD